MIPPYLPAPSLARWLGMLLIATALVAWVAVGFDIANLRLLAREAAGYTIASDERGAHRATSALIFFLQVALFAATAAVFVLWTYGARHNLRALGARRLDYTTAWSIGGFFVPFLNLVRPYQVIREIWKASDPGISDAFAWKETPTPKLLVLWWAGLVAFVGFELVAAGMTLSAGLEPGRFQLARASALLSDVCAAVSASLAYFVVASITEAQRAKWQLQRGSTLT